MKRSLILLLALGLVFGSIATAEAGKKKKRVERQAQGSYTSTGVVAVGLCAQTDGTNCMEIATAANENYLTAKITDSHGLAVPVAVKADQDGDGSTEVLYGTFCGETTEPIQIDPGVPVVFWVGISPDTAALGCPPGTTGTLDATFSNLP